MKLHFWFKTENKTEFRIDCHVFFASLYIYSHLIDSSNMSVRYVPFYITSSFANLQDVSLFFFLSSGFLSHPQLKVVTVESLPGDDLFNHHTLAM